MNNCTDKIDAALAEMTQTLDRAEIQHDKQKLDRLKIYLQALDEYNQHTNLVANSNPENVIKEHVLDSLALLPLLNIDKPMRLIDIGSGAGFPGLIVGIFTDNIQVCLIDSVGKKTRFLDNCIRQLNLEDRISVINTRAEDLAHKANFRGNFDFATARAVSSVDIAAELCLAFLKPGGRLLLQKAGSQVESESKLAEIALPKLNAQLSQISSLNPSLVKEGRCVFDIELLAEPKKGYPRVAAKIKKEPLGSTN